MPDGRRIQIAVDIVQGKTGAPKKLVDDLEKDVMSSQKRIQAASRATDRAILQSQQSTVNAAKTNAKTTANAFLQSLKEMETGAKRSSKNIQSSFDSAFKGGLIGGISGSIFGSFMAQLTSIPSKVRATFDEVIGIAAERQSALTGLSSITAFKGIDDTETQNAIKNLRLVKAGILDIGSASSAMKNLLLTNFTLKESVQLIEAFSDSAAFGKQSSLSFAEAIKGATEGLKQGIPALLDNAGMSKNLSVIMKELGRNEKDAGLIASDLGARQAALTGILKETESQFGNADKLVKTYTGSTAALDMAEQNLLATIGNLIITNPSYLESNRLLTEQINGYTSSVKRADNDTARFTKNSIENYSLLRVSIISDIGAILKTFGSVANALASGFYAISAAVLAPFNVITSGIDTALKTALNKVVQFQNWLADTKLGQWSGITEKLTPYDIPSHEQNMAPTKFLADAAWALSNEATRLGREATAMMNEGRAAREQVRRAGNPRLGWGTMANPYEPSPNRPPSTGHQIDADGGKKKGKGSLSDAGLIEPTVTQAERSRYAAALHKLSPGLKAQIVRAAEYYGIPEALALAQIFSESTFNTTAVSPFNKNVGSSAFGLTQVLPETASRVLDRKVTGRELKMSSQTALQAWGEYMGDLFEEFGDWELAVFAYHNGEGQARQLAKLLGGGDAARTKKFAKKAPKGMAYARKVSALAGLGGDSRFSVPDRKGDPFGIAETFDVGISTEIQGRTALIEAGEKEIEQNKEIISLYKELDEALFSLNDNTEEEILLRKIKLGQYPGLTDGAKEQLVLAAREIDLMKTKIKQQADWEQQVEESREEQRRLFEDTARGWEGLLNDLASGNFKSIWDNLRQQMLDLFIKPASQYLAALFSGQPATAGAGGGGFGGGGGLFGNLLGGLFNSGPGGTPNFNPNSNISVPSGAFGGAAAAGRTGGGMWGGFNDIKAMGAGFRGMSGGGKGLGGLLRGAGGGSMLAGAASIGGMAAGMIGGAIGGKWGNFLSLAGTGVAIGAQFGGPWGALIGGAIGAGIGGIMALFGGDNSTKKLKDAALSAFGISIKDKSVLGALKSLGETMFGKGRVGANADAVVRSDQGQLILRNYAAATNQSSKGIDKLYYGDENWSGNQFRSKFGGFRMTGGPVQAGVSYIVGERRAEVFTPTQSGVISPTVGDPKLIQRLMQVLGQMEETNYQLATKLKSFSPGDVVAMGAAENPEAIGDAVVDRVMTDQKMTDAFARGTGRVY